MMERASAILSCVVGVDIGGTFTESVAITNSGEIYYSKVPTTPSDRQEGVMNGLAALSAKMKVQVGEMLDNTSKFAHGTTSTLNAFLEHKGAKVGLVVTSGFRDTLDIMKAGRGRGLPESERLDYAKVLKPESIVPPWLIEEVTERVDYMGREVVPLNEEQAKTALTRLARSGVEAIAVCLLWSFKNQRHERRIAEIARTIVGSDIPVAVSSELFPVQGEYERMITTVLNSYLSPILSKYVFQLQRRLEELGLKHPVLLMQSNGGLIPGTEAPGKAITTLISGLAGGVIGSCFLSELLGYRNMITTDMGGTSFEVGMIYDGFPVSTNTPLAPSLGPYVSRYQLNVPQIDITAIGSGGGSIAWVDRGTIRVGPVSAGARPGPSCYGFGGVEPTVTDACLILGYLDPENFLGGTMKLDKNLASSVIKERVASVLGMDVVDVAKGIHEIVNNMMADLIRKVTIEKGYDPRHFTLISFGGAGPMNCASYGGELGVQRIIVPGIGLATAYSALGIALSDLKQVFALSDILSTPVDVQRINTHFAGLEKKAAQTLTGWGAKSSDILLIRSADMRYKRQVHEVNVPIPSGILEFNDIDKILNAFERRYEMVFGVGSTYREAGIEFVSYRVEAVGKITRPSLKTYENCGQDPAKESLRSPRPVFFRVANDFLKTPTYTGERLRAGNKIMGPAIIEYVGTTVTVPPDFCATVDTYLNVVLERVS